MLLILSSTDPLHQLVSKPRTRKEWQTVEEDGLSTTIEAEEEGLSTTIEAEEEGLSTTIDAE
ncbi:hypothetical protein IEQ34_019800 [Dendrobium chrysotoxum]|uniref:Uncharacterized protein n=1 Tax=Dendrobium chrysotoxum TaxID=161865 RepID=A0AAV7G804_DENCH|nr:hypothetical protein IEQ34_019800 [Dendrobium chrysotoxum]